MSHCQPKSYGTGQMARYSLTTPLQLTYFPFREHILRLRRHTTTTHKTHWADRTCPRPQGNR